MNNQWQQFAFAVCVQLLLPLMPLLIEFWISGDITNQTFTITAALYSLSIGVSTKNLALLGLSIVVGMAFSCVFGYVVSGKQVHFGVAMPALITIISFMILHGGERYARHVRNNELFIEFGNKSV